MMHFKKNLLAEYKKHDSDETSSSSPPSSPTPSSSSSSTPDKDDPKDSQSGQQARYRVQSNNSMASQSRLRLSSNEQRVAIPLYKIVPEPSPKVQIRDLNHYETSRGKKKVRLVTMSPEPRRRSPTPDSTTISRRPSDIIVEHCDDDSQSQKSPRRLEDNTMQRFQDYPTARSSKSSTSSAQSIASPSSAGLEASSPVPHPPKERRRRRQDTLVPPDCPLKRSDIVDLPIDEFNDLIEKGDFSEAEKAQFRDWRRKGKNRVAARKSREKRIIGIEQLKAARDKKAQQLKDLQHDFDKLERERGNLMIAVQSYEKMKGLRPAGVVIQ